MNKNFNLKVFLSSLLVVFGSAFLGSIFTMNQVRSEWYESIKPAITPPNFVFPIVWNILFFLIAISLYLAWTSADNKIKRTNVAFVFALNLFLNILWSFLYFGMQDPYFAFFDLIALWFSIVMMIAVISKINKLAAYLLIPYLLWVSFAGVLNYISFINVLASSH